MYPHLECSSSNSSCQFIFHCDVYRRTQIRFEGRWVHGHSGSVYLVSFRTQKSSLPASLPLLWYESPRERKSLCPSSFTSVPRPVLGAIGRFPSVETGLFCVLDTINTFNERHSGGNEHMPINTVDIFGSDQVGIHLDGRAHV